MNAPARSYTSRGILAGEAGVGPLSVIIADPPVEPGPQLGAGFDGVQVDAFDFSDRQSRSMKTLSIQRPRPSLLIRTSVSRSKPAPPNSRTKHLERNLAELRGFGVGE